MMTTEEHVNQIANAMLIAIRDVATRVDDEGMLYVTEMTMDGQYASVTVGEGGYRDHVIEVDVTTGKIMA